MQSSTQRTLANMFIAIAFVMLALQLYGMFQTPHPSWSRGLAIPALVLAIAASGLRRRANGER